jgi:hypothetical protein
MPIGRTYNTGWGDRKHVENFDGETSWKFEYEMEENSKFHHRKICSERLGLMELARNHFHDIRD